MKKDIIIPESQGVYVAAVREKNEEFQSLDWNAYIINDKTTAIEMVLIVARGFDQNNTTSTMRHSIKVLPGKSFAKIEFLQDDVLVLNNEFWVSFFENSKLYEKRFTFRSDTIKEASKVYLPVMPAMGILAE